jgi:malonyl-CoA O-methyltransferase
VDGFTHVNRFRTLDTYQRLCRDSGLQLLGLEVRPEVLHFADLRQLTHELKALGAHNLNPGRPGGLTGRARIRALVSAYERYRQTEGLPATYQVVYGLLRKEP